MAPLLSTASTRSSVAAVSKIAAAVDFSLPQKSWIWQPVCTSQWRSCMQLSGHVFSIPTSNILRRLRSGEPYKVEHSLWCRSSRKFSEQYIEQNQDADTKFFDYFSLGRFLASFDASTDKILSTAMFITTVSLQAAEPAYAELTRFSPDQWGRIWILTGVIFMFYLFVIPLIIYNFLRLRWYKRSLPETVFQFMLVFIFFPGMLLLAPFINFRPLPRDPSKAPWEK